MTITTESEAMEVWENQWHNVAILARIYGNPRLNIAVADLRRVIATALEARDAEIARLRKAVDNPDSMDRYWILAEEIAQRDARIAELEGALEAAREKIAGHPFIGVNAAKELLAILTKGKTHD